MTRRFFIVSLGSDTFRDHPLGEFGLDGPDCDAMGRRIGEIGWRVLLLQEGGYVVERLDEAVRRVIGGVASAMASGRRLSS